MPNKRRVLKIIGWVVFLPIFSFMIFVCIVQIAFPDKSVDIVGFKLYSVANTQSMEPELKTNDLIAVKKFDFNKLHIGDYISFNMGVHVNGNPDTITITHQIVEIKYNTETGERGYVTKGLNTLRVDSRLVTKDGYGNTNKYVGKFAFKSTPAGYVFAFVRSPAGIIMLGLNLMCIMGIFFILKLPMKKGGGNEK